MPANQVRPASSSKPTAAPASSQASKSAHSKPSSPPPSAPSASTTSAQGPSLLKSQRGAKPQPVHLVLQKVRWRRESHACWLLFAISIHVNTFGMDWVVEGRGLANPAHKVSQQPDVLVACDCPCPQNLNKTVRSGHPWLYADALVSVPKDVPPGVCSWIWVGQVCSWTPTSHESVVQPLQYCLLFQQLC
jgi:hypothetical protein